jgi:hypothetical protein
MPCVARGCGARADSTTAGIVASESDHGQSATGGGRVPDGVDAGRLGGGVLCGALGLFGADAVGVVGGELARRGMQAAAWGPPDGEAVAQPACGVPHPVGVWMLPATGKVLHGIQHVGWNPPRRPIPL